jgi:hypothetical protein
MISESLNSDHSSRDSSREISVNKKKIDKKSAKKPVATSSPKVGGDSGFLKFYILTFVA